MTMMSLPSVRQRILRPEIMDDPELEAARHAAALRGLVRINALSGSARILWRSLTKVRQTPSAGAIRILDVASGAGDVPIRLWQRAQRAGWAVDIAGCDVSLTAVEFARRRAAAVGANVAFHVANALESPLPEGYDVITCSLFLHHLAEDQAVEFLRRAADATRSQVIINDLDRSRQGYILAWLGTRLLSRSDVVHADGPRSVQGAFTAVEAMRLAERAGLSGARADARWPCRWLLQWAKP